MTTNRYVLAGAALSVYVFVGTLCFFKGHDLGVKEGLDMFHEACYTGGLVVNERTGKVIQCGPLGLVPREELPNFFPKGVDKL